GSRDFRLRGAVDVPRAAGAEAGDLLVRRVRNVGRRGAVRRAAVRRDERGTVARSAREEAADAEERDRQMNLLTRVWIRGDGTLEGRGAGAGVPHRDGSSTRLLAHDRFVPARARAAHDDCELADRVRVV